MERSPYALYDLPPPSGAPVSEIDPFSPAFLADPHPGHAALRDLGPAVWLGRYDVLAVARYAEVREVLGDWRTFCSARGVGMEDFVRHGRYRLPSLILEADPPEHGRARGVLSRVLAPATTARLRDDFAAVADRMVADLVARGSFDGIADLARAFPLAVFPDAVGMAKEGRDKLLPHAEMLFNSFGPRNELFTASLGGIAFEWVEAQGRRERLQPGGLGMMIHDAADRGEIGVEEAPLLVRSLLQAGLDTTINGLGAVLLCLARNPDAFRRLREEPRLARAAFEEALRLESPVQIFFRTATCDTELGGVRVAEGTKVLMLLAAANRDPRRWETPDAYDLDRNTLGHVAFGSGIHACVGQLIARLETRVVLEALARHAVTIELDGEPERRLNNTLRGLSRLPLRVVPA